MWIVVGYSLPDYDDAMRELLRNAALAGDVRRIVLHDPLAAGLAPRWQAVTQVTEIMCLSPIGLC